MLGPPIKNPNASSALLLLAGIERDLTGLCILSFYAALEQTST